MLKFFRKIRQSLLFDNKYTKYLLYAIGEIMLVTIGILIALEINNNNDQRKLRIKEIATLIDLNNDLEKNMNDLRQGINYNLDFKKGCEHIMSAIEKDDSTSVNRYFGQFFNIHHPKFARGSYDNLTNSGINLISDKKIRDQIVYVFGQSLSFFDEGLFKRQYVYNQSVVLPMITKYFYCNGDDYWELNPSNYKEMINDQEFYNMCSILKMYYGRDIRHFNEALREMRSLSADLKKEIKRLKED